MCLKIRRVCKIQTVFYITAIMIIIYLLLYIALEAQFKRKSRAKATLPYVVVHLDLKGAPPKLDYLVKFFALIKDRGANALLIEYEDMFPYEGKLFNLSAKNCYKKARLKSVLSTAAKSGLELIPLVQTFGHMEYVLKQPEFQHLKEDPMYSDSICPSKLQSHGLIKDMLKQVISFHLSIAPLKYIHVGFDEVYHINKCHQCTELNLSNMEIYLWHLNMVRDVVISISENTTVLIWDDMLRSISLAAWNNIDYHYFHKVEPVYWDYNPDLQVTHTNLMKYHQKFTNIWVASAYKGADGKAAVLPNLRRRFANHYCWLNLILDYKFGGEKNKFVFKGMILTGWSRYNHFEPVCELLPVAIPSLVLNLLLVNKYKDREDVDNYNLEDAYINYVETDLKKILECTKSNVYNNDLDNFYCKFCSFDGSEIYNVLHKFILAITIINTELNKIISVDVGYYASPNDAVSSVSQHINDTFKKIIKFENNIANSMNKYYDKYVITEYITSKTFKIKKLLHILQKPLKEGL